MRKTPTIDTHKCRIGPIVFLFTLGAGLALQTGCEESTKTPHAPQETTLDTPAPPRVVSLSAGATRFVMALGATDRLVAVDPESALLPGLGHLPVLDLHGAQAVEPDVVLISPSTVADSDVAYELESGGVRLVEFAPHDLEELASLTRGIGAQLAGVAAATRFERAFSRPFAMVAGLSPGFDRLRVVAVVDLDPLTVAGGHSFETDLIEIGGGTSATHGGEDTPIVMTSHHWEELAPDLVLITTGDLANPLDRTRARALVPERFPIEFFDFNRETFWLHAPEEDAERMRLLISSASSGAERANSRTAE